jgi:hypothetical protein
VQAESSLTHRHRLLYCVPLCAPHACRQVRMIAAALVEVGHGRLTPERLKVTGRRGSGGLGRDRLKLVLVIAAAEVPLSK